MAQNKNVANNVAENAQVTEQQAAPVVEQVTQAQPVEVPATTEAGAQVPAEVPQPEKVGFFKKVGTFVKEKVVPVAKKTGKTLLILTAGVTAGVIYSKIQQDKHDAALEEQYRREHPDYDDSDDEDEDDEDDDADLGGDGIEEIE